MKYRALIFLLIIITNYNSNLISQSYVWPTDASYYLSSSFAEWRYGHFHAGIDIKTNGTTGYPVYAIRSGHIWRIRVSPYGYGKVLYHKLDTGEIVVYAHLEKFVGKLEEFVKSEQNRKQEYSINKYFNPADFPVEQGEIIAYTGESGIGPAHLHFEMRDKYNRPFNPLTKGYKVKDTLAPGISKFAIIPLRASSEINGEYQAEIFYPVLIRSGQYKINQILQISGEIGFAVQAYDPINYVTNKLGIYELKFFIDENLVYSATYDQFSYSYTDQIMIDRDFRLMRRGDGVFYRCFRDYRNELTFYHDFAPGAGMIDEKVLTLSKPNPADTSHAAGQSEQPQRRHEFRIELADFFGNTTNLSGDFIYRAVPVVNPEIQIDERNRVNLAGLSKDNLEDISYLSTYISYNNGQTWSPVFAGRTINQFLSYDSTGAHFNPRYIATLSGYPNTSQIIKITASDKNRHELRPYFQIIKTPENPMQRKAYFDVAKDFLDDFIYFNIKTSTPVLDTPRLSITQGEGLATQVALIRKDLNEFIGCYRLLPGRDGLMRIEIDAVSIDNRGIYYEELFPIYSIQPSKTKRISSNDQCCFIEFPLDGIYSDLYCRISTEDPEPSHEYGFVGQSYQVEPTDVILKKSAKIALCYPEDTLIPEQLGVYSASSNGRRWRYSGSSHDPKARTISTSVSSFGKYVLIRDTESPEITLLYPVNGYRITNTTPKIRVKITDNLSGVPGDSQYMRMLLDSQRVIAEFDPEKDELIYLPEEPLTKGLHELIIAVRDRAGNVNEKAFKFTIL